MPKYTPRLLPPERRYLFQDRTSRHYRHTFYLNPIQLDNWQYPPKMVTIKAFTNQYGYTKGQIMSLLRNRQLFGMSFKKWLFICPNPLCFVEEITLDFWKRR
jgi:hypothetical protein